MKRFKFLLLLSLLLVGCGESKISFENVYDEIVREKAINISFIAISSDKQMLYTDSNPSNIVVSGTPYSEGLDVCQQTLFKCGFDTDIWRDMGRTTYYDGHQTRTAGNITVTWRYHPNYGLEATYTYVDNNS